MDLKGRCRNTPEMPGGRKMIFSPPCTQSHPHPNPPHFCTLRIGTRVIKDRDGRPAVRDPTFLSETQIMQKRDTDRILLRCVWGGRYQREEDPGACGVVLDEKKRGLIDLYGPGESELDHLHGSPSWDLLSCSFLTHQHSIHTITLSHYHREGMEAGATGTVRLSDPDVPVTLYSESVAKGTYTGTVTVSLLGEGVGEGSQGGHGAAKKQRSCIKLPFSPFCSSGHPHHVESLPVQQVHKLLETHV